MARSLVIVESPAKAKTINKYLGRNYNVKASYGHVMDLPKKTIGILLPGDQNGKKKSKRKSKGKGKSKAAEKKPVKPIVVTAENIFEPTYEVIPTKLKVIGDRKRAAVNAEAIYLAGDPDREGEAICAHLAEILSKPRKYTKVVADAVAAEAAEENGNGDKSEASAKPAKKPEAEIRKTAPKIYRVMFNEITQKAIKAAFEHPTEVNANLVDAQQARRVLDRLVGYKISPILWDKVRRGLSAGRVQSVALKLICDREREIEGCIPEEYWHIPARLTGADPPEFDARLARIGDAAAKVTNEADARRILSDLEHATFTVSSVATKERKKHAVPPFITSKLQQASRFPVKKTMMVAQQLYEGIELPGEDAPVGLITYMRTDSVRVAEQATTEGRARMQTHYGDPYVPDEPNRYRVKANAQDAHEAIRPTSTKYSPDEVRPHLTPDQFYLYRLIWDRFIASQMTPAVFDDTTADITAGVYTVPAKGSVPKFAGWLAVYGQSTGEAEESERTEVPSPAPGGTTEAEDTAASGL